MTERWIFASVTAMAHAIREGEITSEALVDAHIARIEAINPQLNALVQETFATARQRATEADAMTQRGQRWGPLHGVPMSLKDSLDTAGVITTGGLREAQDRIPEEDATVVKRLKAAGAILLGKTNTPAMTLSFETTNGVYGTTRNPYDLDRTPGGSSGGAAALIAAGGSPFDIGSDTGGSIRQPAHNCGIVGLKPTSGRVPRTGHLVSFDGHLEALTQLGPMARYVEDIALLLPLIAGVDWRDPAIVPMPLTSPEDVSLEGLRVAWYTGNGHVEARADIHQITADVAAMLASQGALVSEACPPQAELAPSLFDALFEIDGYAWVQRLRQRMGGIARVAPGNALGAHDLTALLESWQRFRGHILRFMESFDVLISPPFTHPAMGHEEVMMRGLGDGYGLLNLYNLLGWPVAVVRAGTSQEGLPVGVQIAARPWREDVALAVAACVEEHSGGWQPPSL